MKSIIEGISFFFKQSDANKVLFLMIVITFGLGVTVYYSRLESIELRKKLDDANINAINTNNLWNTRYNDALIDCNEKERANYEERLKHKKDVEYINEQLKKIYKQMKK